MLPVLKLHESYVSLWVISCRTMTPYLTFTFKGVRHWSVPKASPFVWPDFPLRKLKWFFDTGMHLLSANSTWHTLIMLSHGTPWVTEYIQAQLGDLKQSNPFWLSKYYQAAFCLSKLDLFQLSRYSIWLSSKYCRYYQILSASKHSI